MARPVSEYPTELELRILKQLWLSHPQTVDSIRESLAADGRELTHSSVITVMNIMVNKGYLRRDKNGRAFEFTPLCAEQDVSRNMLGDLINRVFDGSASALMLELLETGDIDTEELDAIRRLINRKSREMKQ